MSITFKIKEFFLLKISSCVRLLREEISTNTLIKHGLTVGDNFSRQGGVKIDASYCHLITIGDDVGLAPNVILLAHDNSPKRFCGLARVGRIDIGNHVFVGAGTIILPGVKIGDNVIIGAGSVVSRDIPPNSVAVGNPAKVVKRLEEFVQKTISTAKGSPVFENNDFSTLSLTEEKRKEMKEKLSDGIGYYKTVQYSEFNSLER
ncbi:MAG: acyltransferase [Muribaculaceae bacterium]